MAAVLAAAGCSGNGDGGANTVSEKDVEQVRSDPRILSVRGIFERADTRLIPGVHLEFSATAGGRGERESLAFAADCTGTGCVLSGDEGEGTIALADLITEDAIVPTDIDLTKLELGKRDGFHTLVVKGRSGISEKFSDETDAAFASGTSGGVWGKHGYAAVEIVGASLEGGSLSGSMSGTAAYVFGDRNPTNPEGIRSATWQGPAEVASTRTFVRYEGKATLTIPDLAQPRIGAAIEVGGNDISAPAWKDMPLSQGHFTAGEAGQDYMAGNLHGPRSRGSLRRLRNRGPCRCLRDYPATVRSAWGDSPHETISNPGGVVRGPGWRSHVANGNQRLRAQWGYERGRMPYQSQHRQLSLPHSEVELR